MIQPLNWESAPYDYQAASTSSEQSQGEIENQTVRLQAGDISRIKVTSPEGHTIGVVSSPNGTKLAFVPNDRTGVRKCSRRYDRAIVGHWNRSIGPAMEDQTYQRVNPWFSRRMGQGLRQYRIYWTMRLRELWGSFLDAVESTIYCGVSQYIFTPTPFRNGSIKFPLTYVYDSAHCRQTNLA